MTNSPAHVRNLVLTTLVLILIVLVGVREYPAAAAPPLAPRQQTTDYTWNPVSGTLTVSPGQQNAQFNTTLFNRATTIQYYNITTNVASLGTGWAVRVAPASTNVSVPANGSQPFSFFVSVPSDAPLGTYTLEITAQRLTSPGGPPDGSSSLAIVTINVVTPTPTPTISLTPTRTVSPTPTVGPVCPEGNRDPGGGFGSARLALVDAAEEHGICERGDEDWFRFGAVGGKVYTIDISEMDDGLDLSLELYDESERLLTSNDDFFLRDPARPNPSDIRPRIQSWRAPRNGFYYVRVRDILNLGGGNRTYTFVINSESAGPTPVVVPEICRDLFEEDGLPEEARLITSNEIQPNRRLCPSGDADWVRFFGKAGKIYYIYTDTRPYRNNPDINNQTQAGADTIMYLADRDGIRIIDFNDDVAGSLDSQIRFVPQVDGFYYAQVKNTGDIGNQFIEYDLILQQCVPDQECGRSPQVATVPTLVTPPAPGQATVQPTPTTTVAPFVDQTPTASVEGSAGNFASQQQKPGALIDGPLVGFADPAFDQIWQRTDRIVAEGRASRTWLWGPRGLMARAEGYRQAGGGMRQVQYFDKGRMEINDPGARRTSPWFVTSGLLVSEMVSGRVQIGDGEYVQRPAAAIVVAGDMADPNAPTYASFAAQLDVPARDRTGQLPLETLDRSGRVGSYGTQRPETRLVRYVPETGRNIPAVFWEYLNARGPVYVGGRLQQSQLFDWVFLMGYPVSEPYWARVRIDGVERDVLVQLYERRVLTYTPDNPAAWRVEMGNVGRHYYRWRYEEELP